MGRHTESYRRFPPTLRSLPNLGCERDEKGGVVTDPMTEDTSVPGVYVAGDVSRDVLMVSIAIAEGAKAAVAINKAFLRRDGLCE